MENNVDVVHELQIKNQELYINKLIIDLENAMESLLIFYSNYLDTNIKNINEKIISLLDDKQNIEKCEIITQVVNSFFNLFKDKLNSMIKDRLTVIKSNIQNIDTFNYEKMLNNESLIIVNQISDYYQENVYMLIDEIIPEAKLRKLDIKDYLLNTVYLKIINTLKDKLMYSIKLINNNYDENTTMLKVINQKTLK